jgi:hypothetical protein
MQSGCDAAKHAPAAHKRGGGPCKERLWFENRLTLGIKAWSVELDQDDRVIEGALVFAITVCAGTGMV